MSSEKPGHANVDKSAKLDTSAKVAPIFGQFPRAADKITSPQPANGANAQFDPLRELVGSLQRWDDHFHDNIRDVERRLTGLGDKVEGHDEKVRGHDDRIRKHDEMFPAVRQSLQAVQESVNTRLNAMQGSLTSQAERLGRIEAQLETQSKQFVTVEAGLTQANKDIAALRADIRAVKRKRSWTLTLALLALLGVAALAAVQYGLVDVATALIRIVDFG